MKNVIVFRVENCLVKGFDVENSFERKTLRERWKGLKELRDVERKVEKIKDDLGGKDLKEGRVKILNEKLKELEKDWDKMMGDEKIKEIRKRNEMNVKRMCEKEEEEKKELLKGYVERIGKMDFEEVEKVFFRDLECLRRIRDVELIVVGMESKGVIESLLCNNGVKDCSIRGFCRDGSIIEELEDVEDKSMVVVFSNNEKDIEECVRNGIKVVGCDWKNMEEIWRGIGLTRCCG